MEKMRYLRTLTLIAVLATVPAAGLAADSTQQQARQATFGNLIAALNNLAVEIQELEALNDLTIGDVRLVNVSDLLNGNNVEALNNALNRNKTEVARLTNVLNNNTVLTDFLKNNNIAVSRVIAIDVLSGGGVTVFAQPQ
jgi:hypothetical protein